MRSLRTSVPCSESFWGNTPRSQNQPKTMTTMPPGFTALCSRSRMRRGLSQRSSRPAHSTQLKGVRTVSRKAPGSVCAAAVHRPPQAVMQVALCLLTRLAMQALQQVIKAHGVIEMWIRTRCTVEFHSVQE